MEVDRAHFCAHPRSKTKANSSSQAGKQIACIGAETQHHSKRSQFVIEGLLTTAEGEVGGSGPSRPTILTSYISDSNFHSTGENGNVLRNFLAFREAIVEVQADGIF